MTPEKALEHLRAELDYEILEMKRVLKVGGIAVWRSAAKRPWYRQRFEAAGFKGEWYVSSSLKTVLLLKEKKIVQPIDIRENQEAIDRVNMYASCELRFHVSL